MGRQPPGYQNERNCDQSDQNAHANGQDHGHLIFPAAELIDPLLKSWENWSRFCHPAMFEKKKEEPAPV